MLMAILDTSAPLTTEQKAPLTAELTEDPEGRDYATPIAAGNWEQVRLLLMGHYTIEQDEQYVLKHIVTGPEILNWIAPLRMVVTITAPEGIIKSKWQEILSAWSGIDTSYSFDPATSTKWAYLKATVGELVNAQGARIITEADIRTLETTYAPATMANASPRSWSVLGMGKVVEVADLVALRAEGLI